MTVLSRTKLLNYTLLYQRIGVAVVGCMLMLTHYGCTQDEALLYRPAIARLSEMAEGLLKHDASTLSAEQKQRIITYLDASVALSPTDELLRRNLIVACQKTGALEHGLRTIQQWPITPKTPAVGLDSPAGLKATLLEAFLFKWKNQKKPQEKPSTKLQDLYAKALESYQEAHLEKQASDLTTWWTSL
ncbi:MAG: hypothetical protein ACKO37_05950 [Vampirovibrionales bacterium]